MPLLEHLKEFRTRLFKSVLAVSCGFVLGWIFYNPIIVNLSKPVCDLQAAQAAGATNCGSLYINGVLGPLNLQIKVAILAGVIMMAPVWLYQLWAFIAPALHRREKRNSVFFFIAATPFLLLEQLLVIWCCQLLSTFFLASRQSHFQTWSDSMITSILSCV